MNHHDFECARELEFYLKTLRKNRKRGKTPVPWLEDTEWNFVEAEIPALEREIRAVYDAATWFPQHVPEWPLRLVLAPQEGLRLMQRGMVTWQELFTFAFSYSLWGRYYDYRTHPEFYPYCQGVTALMAKEQEEVDPLILELCPPQLLPGLEADFRWRPLR